MQLLKGTALTLLCTDFYKKTKLTKTYSRQQVIVTKQRLPVVISVADVYVVHSHQGWSVYACILK